MVFVEWPATEANSYVFRNMHLKWWICIMCVLPQVIPWLKHGRSWGLHGSVAKQSPSHGRGQHISFLIVSLIALFRALLWDERGSFAFLFLLWKVEVVDILIGPFMPYKPDALPLSSFLSCYWEKEQLFILWSFSVLISYFYRRDTSYFPSGVVSTYSMRNLVTYSRLWPLASNPR